MKVREISEDEMNSSPRKVRQEGNPTAILRKALRNNQYVIELVKDTKDEDIEHAEVYECSLSGGNIQRHKMKGIKKNKYHWKDYHQKDVMHQMMETQGFHEHKSGSVHEILTLDSKTKWNTMVEIVKEERRTKREKAYKRMDKESVIEGIQYLIDYYEPRVEGEIWDIDPGKLSKKSHINKRELLTDLFRVIKYAKENELTIDSAMTALELEDSAIYQDIKKHTTRSNEERKLKLYRKGKKAYKE